MKTLSISSLYLLVLLFGIAEAATIPGSCSTPGSCVDLEPTFQEVNVKNEIKLTDGDGSNYVGLKSATTVGSDIVWTLPNADGTAGQVLKTDGSGALSWGALSGTVASGVQTNADPTANLTGALVGDVAYDTTNGELQVYDGTSWVNVNTANDPLSGLSCSDGELTKWNDTSGEWECGVDDGGISSESDPVAIAQIGDRSYTEDNYVVDSESVTASLDSLDQSLKDASDLVATNTTGIATNLASIGANTTSISTNTTDIGTNTTSITTNATAITSLSDEAGLGDLSCGDGELAKWNDTSGEWECGVDGVGSGVDTEPWFGTDDDAGAGSNTEDIYSLGNVLVGGIGQVGGADPKLLVRNADDALTTGNYAATELLQLSREGTYGDKWSANAQFKLGSYSNHPNARSSLEIALTNANNESVYDTVMTINGSGRVGIGTTAPTTKLQVSGTNEKISIQDTGATLDSNGQKGRFSVVDAAGAELGYFGYATNFQDIGINNNNALGGIAMVANGINTMRLIDGKVGIGTTAPTEKLDVDGEARIRTLTAGSSAVDSIVVADADGVLKKVSTASVVAASEPWFGVDDDAGATDNTEDIYSLGKVGIGTTSPANKLHIKSNTGVFEVVRVENSTAGGSNIRYVDNANTPIEIGSENGDAVIRTNSTVRLIAKTGSGNVGIGTTSPARALHVEADSAILRITDKNNTASDNAAAAYIEFRGNDGQIGWIGDGSSGSNDMTVLAENEFIVATGGSGSPRLSVNTAGNVGIGTTTPTYKLEVSGASSDASVNGVRVGKGGGDISTNTAVGNDSLYSNTTGYYNTATGYQTLRNNTTGNYNTATGRNVLYTNTTGHRNTAIGSPALYSNTTGHHNTAVGSSALYTNTIGENNVAHGANSLLSNTTGSNNTAQGTNSLYYNTTGNNNLATGFSSLHSNTTGEYNVANGYSALYYNTTGSWNTASGSLSLHTNTTGSNNVATGHQSLFNNTTGLNNSANGVNSLFSNTIGEYNTANGYSALFYNTAGSWNTASGGLSLHTNTTGSNNVATGQQSLFSNTTGSSNTANGVNSLYSNTTGSNNVANGYSALFNNTTGESNTAYGVQALYFNTTGINNMASGIQSLFSNTTGSSNTANGSYALFDNISGDNNSAYGHGSLNKNTSGLSNTAAGFSSLGSNTTGNYNTASGGYALYFNTTGTNNTSLGYSAGNNLTTGDNNIIIGANIDAPSATASNQLNIGNWIYGVSGDIGIGTTAPLSDLHVESNGFTDLVIKSTGANSDGSLWLSSASSSWRIHGDKSESDKFVIENWDAYTGSQAHNNTPFAIDTNGNVGIGTTAPSHKLHVIGTAGLSTGTAWTNTSDIRLKDIQGDYENGLEEVLALRAVRFNYKKDNPLDLPSDTNQIGFVAQEVQKVIPEAVTEREDGYLELNVDPIHWAMVNGFKEIWDRVSGNKEKVEILEKKVENLMRVVEQQQTEINILKNN